MKKINHGSKLCKWLLGVGITGASLFCLGGLLFQEPVQRKVVTYQENSEQVQNHEDHVVVSPYFNISDQNVLVAVTDLGRQQRELKVPDGVREIGELAFSKCSDLKTVQLPNGLVSIGNAAFKDCKKLVTINFPSSVEEIGQDVFNGCDLLTDASVISNSTVLFDWWVAQHHYGNQTLAQKAEIDLALYKNSAGKDFSRIGPNAFGQCPNLTKITIPETILEIDENAFSNCHKLTSDHVVNHSTVLFDWWADHHQYDQNNLTDLVKKNGKVDLSQYKNSDGKPFTSIGGRAFYNCIGLKSVVLNNEINSIGNLAFSSCFDLESINLPAGLTKIGNDAFNACHVLDNITVPKTVNYLGARAFASCLALTNITLGEGIKTIATGTFKQCQNLKRIKLPDTLTLIDNQAFASCYKLTSMTVPEGVKIIGHGVWNRCKSLVSLSLPTTLTKIGALAFANCTSLEMIIIPENVKLLGDRIFANDYHLKQIFILGEDVNYYEHLIEDINNDRVVYYVSDLKLVRDLLKWGVKPEQIRKVN